jgi:hypothetical protein
MSGASVRNSLQRILGARTNTLWIGFAGLLSLMVFIAVDSGRMLRSVAATSLTLRRESRDRDALLDLLRSDIYHSGTIVRDYLLQTQDAGAAVQKTELESVRARIDDTLQRYEHFSRSLGETSVGMGSYTFGRGNMRLPSRQDVIASK